MSKLQPSLKLAVIRVPSPLRWQSSYRPGVGTSSQAFKFGKLSLLLYVSVASFVFPAQKSVPLSPEYEGIWKTQYFDSLINRRAGLKSGPPDAAARARAAVDFDAVNFDDFYSSFAQTPPPSLHGVTALSARRGTGSSSVEHQKGSANHHECRRI